MPLLIGSENHGDTLQKVLVPTFSMGHSPIGLVGMPEVDALIEKGILVECDGKKIYALKGRALGFICADPSLQEHKIRILNREGPLSIWSQSACGLRFDPYGPFQKGAENEIQEIIKFLDGAGSHHFKLRAAVFGAHAPCGMVLGMSLEDICRTVASGAQYFKTRTGLDIVIPTIFINAEVRISPHLPPQQILLWMYINKEAVL